EQYFEEHASTGELDQIHIQQIIFIAIRTPDWPLTSSGTAAKREEIRRLAEQTLAKAKAGEDFTSLMNACVDDPNAQAQASGFVSRDTLTDEECWKTFEKLAWSLERGEISGIVETPFGFHIIKMLERRPP